MKKIKTIVCSLSFLSLVSINAHSQDECRAIGWATHQGTVTGGSGTPVVVTTIDALISNAKAGGKVIHVSGTMGAGAAAGGSRVDVGSNTTIIGLPGATVKAFVSLSGVSNVILRNLIFQGPGAVDVDGLDNVTVQNSTRVWIDHCDFRDGQDGNMDIKRESDFVAVTWCKFSYGSSSSSHKFSTLVGHDDTFTADADNLRVTFQYNWFAEGVQERMPRVRFGQVHVVNNLYTSSAQKLGVTAGHASSVRVENNAFVGVKVPIDLSKMTGGAVMTAVGNLFPGSTGNTAGKGTAFTPPYQLTVAPADKVETLVKDAKCGAGATLGNAGCACKLLAAEEELNKEALHITAYPNPFEENMTIYNNGSFKYSVYNASGMEVEKGEGKDEVEVGRSLNKGFYIVKLISGNRTSSLKIEKK